MDLTEEKYLIGDKEFILRDDFTMNELDEIAAFTEPWKAVDKKTISCKRNYSNKDIQHIVKMVVIPIDGSDKDSFDFGQLKPEMSVLILADFLKKKAIENIFMTALSQNYTNELNVQLQKMKN
jgi:hypothetical protein